MIVSVIGGTGSQGLGIALRLAIEGVDVIVGSRKEEKALTVVQEAKEKYADYDLSKMCGMSMKMLQKRRYFNPHSTACSTKTDT